MRSVLAVRIARCCSVICLVGMGALITASPNEGIAAPLGYSFTGVVTSASDALATNPTPPPYGVFIANGTPITGHFYYDSNTDAVSAGDETDTSIYSQTISNGFAVTIGGLNLSADTYAAVVLNNVRGRDEFQVIYSNNLPKEPPADPLMVNGTPYTVSDLELDFNAATSLFPNSQLPSSLALANFNSRISELLQNGSPGSIDLFCTITSLTPIPVLAGDLNRDGKVDASDIAAMMQMLTDPWTYQKVNDLTNDDMLALGDLDDRAGIDSGDLKKLLDILRSEGGGAASNSVPEPSSLNLLVASASLMAVVRRRRMKVVEIGRP
jgi:hypothetical protein